MYSDLSEFGMHKVLQEMRISRLRRGVDPACREITLGLPVGREIPKERRPQRGAATLVLGVPPDHVVRAAYFDAHDVGPGRVWQTLPTQE